MAKKFDDVLAVMNKFVGGLLLVLITTGFAMNSKLGAIESQSNATSKSVDSLSISVQENTVELVALKTQNTHIIDEQAEIKPIVMLTRNEQISRTDEIDFVQSLRGTP